MFPACSQAARRYLTWLLEGGGAWKGTSVMSSVVIITRRGAKEELWELAGASRFGINTLKLEASEGPGVGGEGK